MSERDSIEAAGGATNRREFLLASAAIGTSAVSGCAALNQQTGPETVAFAISPNVSKSRTRKLWEPLVDYIESEVDGIEGELAIVQNKSAIREALQSGQAQLGFEDIVLIADPDAYDVIGISEVKGSPWYYSFIYTLPEYDIDSLEDLRGETVALADPLSTSGSLYPLFMLKEAGLDIGGAPTSKEGKGELDFTYSDHNQAKETLINREPIKAAGSADLLWAPNIPREQFPDRFFEYSAMGEAAGTDQNPEFKLLSLSKKIPFGPMFTTTDWDSDKRPEVEEAILSMGPDDVDWPEDADAPLTSIAPGSIDDYQQTIEVVNTLGIDFGL